MQTENENLKVTANMGTMGLALGPCSLPGQVVNKSLVLMVVVMLVMVMILFVDLWMVVKNVVLLVLLVPAVFPDMLSIFLFKTRQEAPNNLVVFPRHCLAIIASF